VLFRPGHGFSGRASFNRQADDGVGFSGPVPVPVSVRAAPLLYMDYVQRNPRLTRGQHTDLSLVGEFTDEDNVPLPASYLYFSSNNAAAARVSASGRVTARADGWGVLLASSHGIQAATACVAGPPAGLADRALAVLGPHESRGAVTRAAQGGPRQTALPLPDGSDGAPASTGTLYYPTNPAVLDVSPDGLITGKAAGH